jgi:hypothetical protein
MTSRAALARRRRRDSQDTSQGARRRQPVVALASSRLVGARCSAVMTTSLLWYDAVDHAGGLTGGWPLSVPSVSVEAVLAGVPALSAIASNGPATRASLVESVPNYAVDVAG